MRNYTLLFWAFFLLGTAGSFTGIFQRQTLAVYLKNPSFEDQPQDATTPTDWHPCNPGTTPDILPGFWGVETEPSEGETYVGLITRSDGSREAIGQRLSRPLKAKECYRLTLDLAHSYTYAGYNKPVKLRIWGGTSLCEKGELLDETDFIENEDWKTFKFDLLPEKEVKYLILEAFYKEENANRQGNILIDNIRPLQICPRA